jgi:hypothetical protein
MYAKLPREKQMKTPIENLIHRSNTNILRLALLTGLAAAAPFLSMANDQPSHAGHEGHEGHEQTAPAKLVQIVRDATRQYLDVNSTAPDYQPAFGCVSGPDHGAMGVHYINGALVGDGAIDGQHPEALIYEPSEKGLRLVGVEYIVDAATWMAQHNAPPMLEGQAFHLVNSPNQYGLPAFFELHVWAWRDNPQGAFVDWNNRVSCEGQ